jgi:hypothetical protein
MAVAVAVGVTMAAAVEVRGLQLLAFQNTVEFRSTEVNPFNHKWLLRKSEELDGYCTGLCGQPLIRDDKGSLPHPPA